VEIGVGSSFFLAEARVQLDGVEYRYLGLLERGGLEPGRVHWRTRGWFDPIAALPP
jgi:hypothetical protein